MPNGACNTIKGRILHVPAGARVSNWKQNAHQGGQRIKESKTISTELIKLKQHQTISENCRTYKEVKTANRVGRHIFIVCNFCSQPINTRQEEMMYGCKRVRILMFTQKCNKVATNVSLIQQQKKQPFGLKIRLKVQSN